MIKRITSALLLFCMLLFGLAGCSSGGSEKVMEYKGYTVTKGMYCYWMKRWKEDYISKYTDVEDTEAFWTAENASGGTNEEYITATIQTRIRYYLVAQALFDDYKLKLSEESQQKIEDDLNSQIDYYGSRSQLSDYLKEEYGLTVSMLKEVYTFEARYTELYNYLYSTGGKLTASPDELDAYYHNYYARVKYVMFLKSTRYVYDEEGNRVTDANGYYTFENLTDEEKEKVKQTANDVYEAVKGGADIEPYFKQYMSEFRDVENYPNGFYITADEYTLHTAAVTEAALNMEVGEVRLVENESCYFVVQKFDLIDKAYSSAADKGQFTYLVSYCNGEKFAAQFEELAKGITEYEDAMAVYRLKDL